MSFPVISSFIFSSHESLFLLGADRKKGKVDIPRIFGVGILRKIRPFSRHFRRSVKKLLMTFSLFYIIMSVGIFNGSQQNIFFFCRDKKLFWVKNLFIRVKLPKMYRRLNRTTPSLKLSVTSASHR